jgi:hypothetical protein
MFFIEDPILRIKGFYHYLREFSNFFSVDIFPIIKKIDFGNQMLLNYSLTLEKPTPWMGWPTQDIS